MRLDPSGYLITAVFEILNQSLWKVVSFGELVKLYDWGRNILPSRSDALLRLGI
jgi:hypothetical protein